MCTRILHGPSSRGGWRGDSWSFIAAAFCGGGWREDIGGREKSFIYDIIYVCVWVICIQFFFSPRCCGKRHKSVREDIFDRAAAATATADQRRSSSSSVPRRMAIKIINYINNVRSHPSNCITHIHTYYTQSFDVKPIAHKLRNFLRPSSS